MSLLAATLSPNAAAVQEPAVRRAERPSIRALPLSAPIAVDGDLTDPAWADAEVGSGFVQREPRQGEPATEDTELSVAFTRSTLYVAIRAYDSDPQAVIAKEMERDADLFQDDSILLVFDTFLDGRNAYAFSTNANGARTDSLVTDEGRDVNQEWDGVWTVAARRTDWGWAAEFAIPFSTLRFDRSLDTWGLNVERRLRRKNEESHWAALPREAGAFQSSAAYRVSLAGRLTGLEGLTPSRQLDVKPYVLGSAVDDPVADTGSDFDAGLDVKWGVTRSLAVDLTYNTDFAEVEVDDLRVNLTRFSLFFPEKRDFFLENAGIFDFGPPQRVPWEPPLLKAFFSRRIGLDAGQTVPIDWGGRLTGRQGGWNLGVLGVGADQVDEAGRFVPRTGFAVGRVKRNLGGRSSIGAIFTERDASGAPAQRLYGVDLEYKPTQRWKANGYWSRSDEAGAQGDDRSFGLGLEHKGPTLTASYDLAQAGELYDPAVGFLLRDDFRLDAPRLLWQPRIQKWGIRNGYLEAEMQRYERSSDGLLESQRIELTPIGMLFESGDFASLARVFSTEQLFVPFEIFPGIVIPPGRYEFEHTTSVLQTDRSRAVSVDLTAVSGGFYDGDLLYLGTDLGLRLSRHFRAFTSWDLNDVELPQGSFEINLYSQRFDVSFTPDLRLNFLAQYNDITGDLGVNLRFHWIYKPGADLYVVYNENWIAPDLGSRLSTGRQLIVKLTYLWQR